MNKPTPVELAAIQLIADGNTIAQAAVEVDRGFDTVKDRLRWARYKTDAANTTHLVAICLREGWIR